MKCSVVKMVESFKLNATFYTQRRLILILSRMHFVHCYVFYCRLFLILHWLRLLLFQSRVTLECVYDLKPRYFVRPTIMMTSLKQTKVANKRDKRKIRKHKKSKNEKLRSSGTKKGEKNPFHTYSEARSMVRICKDYWYWKRDTKFFCTEYANSLRHVYVCLEMEKIKENTWMLWVKRNGKQMTIGCGYRTLIAIRTAFFLLSCSLLMKTLRSIQLERRWR